MYELIASLVRISTIFIVVVACTFIVQLHSTGKPVSEWVYIFSLANIKVQVLPNILQFILIPIL